MSAESSDMEDESVGGQTTPNDGMTTSLMSSLGSYQPGGNNNEFTLLKAMRSLLEILNAERRLHQAKDERTLLLTKLISKVQPELPQKEVEARVEALKEKFKDFNIEQLRQLVGEVSEDSSDSSAAVDTVKESEPVEKSPKKSPDNFIEEEFDEDEQTLLDSLDLDDEGIAELENDINAELQEKLSEMGIQADGTII